MSIFELLLIAVGLSMDAFAVAICHGVTMRKVNFKKMLIVGLYFGIFQAGMPVIGYFIGYNFADIVQEYDHWIAFVLLVFLGIRMIKGSFDNQGCLDRVCGNECCDDRECPNGTKPNNEEAALDIKTMVPLAVATSIDALAIGVSFAFMKVNITYAASFIGITTLLFSMIGVKIGHIFGTKYKSKAELVGGIILICLGIKILVEHLGII